MARLAKYVAVLSYGAAALSVATAASCFFLTGQRLLGGINIALAIGNVWLGRKYQKMRWRYQDAEMAQQGVPVEVRPEYEEYLRDFARAQEAPAARQYREQMLEYQNARRRLGPEAMMPGLAIGGMAPFMGGPSPAAQQKARTLLLRLMTPGQRRQWAAHGSFIENAPDGTAYVLTLMQVFRIDPETGERLEYWCVQSGDPSMPPEDAVISRLLHIRSDPRRLKKMANAMPMDRPVQRVA